MKRSSSTSPFTVTRREALLIPPSGPTPRELKPLSDIDDQDFLRMYVHAVHIYPAGRRSGEEGTRKDDPVRVIRKALGKALVYYYPFAGRLMEGLGRKLSVDCTGEGVLFVEADADVTLEGLAAEDGLICPPFEYAGDLLPADIRISCGVLNPHLISFQVTRLKCGGFVVGVSMNHSICDASGLVQFMNAVAEFARGATHPSVLPVWSRELLMSTNPMQLNTSTHQEYDHLKATPFPVEYANDRVIERSFFFGNAAISALRRNLQSHLSRATTFELLAAFLWRCRTLALRFEDGEELCYFCAVNIKSVMKSPPIPSGYYGNTFILPSAVATAGELRNNSLDYAVELIKKAKAEVTEEYVRLITDLFQTARTEVFNPVLPGSWCASDNTREGFHDTDFGWGKPVYGGPSSAMVGAVPGTIGFLVRVKNGKGESGVMILICLPETAMERFAAEVECVAGKNTDIISKL